MIRHSALTHRGSTMAVSFSTLSHGTILRGLGCVLVAAVLMGCGDDPPPQAQPQRKPAEERKVGFAPRRKKKEEPKGLDLSGVDPDTIFEVAETPLPNYVALGPAPPKPEEIFVAEISPGRDSTAFVASVPGESTGAAAATPFQMPRGFAAVESARVINGAPAEILCQTDGSRMVLVPGGEGLVGSNSGPRHWGPQTRVPLDPFYIGAQEVTVAQYKLFRQKAGVAGKKVEEPLNRNAPSDHPALGVTWGEARLYSQWIGGAMPTEVQWERAARGSQGLAAPWGNTRPLWRTPRTLEQIDSVGTHPDDRSPFGVLDMAGNAREWVGDFFRDDSFSTLSELTLDRRRNWTGPRSPSVAAQRVVKGNGPDWTVYNRDGVRMTERSDRIGFRCVLNLPGAAAAN